MRIVDENNARPAVISNGVDNSLMVVRTEAHSVVDQARCRGKYLEIYMLNCILGILMYEEMWKYFVFFFIICLIVVVKDSLPSNAAVAIPRQPVYNENATVIANMIFCFSMFALTV